MGAGQCCCPDGDKGQPVGFEKQPEKPDIEVPPPQRETETISASPPAPAAVEPDEPPAPTPEPPKPEPEPAPAPAPAEKPSTVTITLVRDGKSKVGMRVGVHADHPGKTVLRAVLEGGLAEKWNVEKGVDEGKQFVEGDQILEVNGETTADGIPKALADQSKQELVIVMMPLANQS
mmetsp:Transcript_28885/g.66556  ORF Transcript_28885/g.66556 Transcript_28885/m.66556 type:complete len:176 (-) Transcript_28885:164-691(-)